ncbi:Imm48 family immunity protein [Carnobacterium gallinarum]|uniref:Imm48 family immunity protein n=1 Tax=Carnobacterium gallinarum TaxID=2749 RepID=UPI000ABD0BA8|nr:Imm48 family immunity protein [Carnobacterium gallinarum]
MINGLGQKKGVTPTDIQGGMIQILNEKLDYSTLASAQFTKFLIESTDKKYHPTMSAIIHRGLNGYFMYSEKKVDELKEDFSGILKTIQEHI